MCSFNPTWPITKGLHCLVGRKQPPAPTPKPTSRLCTDGDGDYVLRIRRRRRRPRRARLSKAPARKAARRGAREKPAGEAPPGHDGGSEMEMEVEEIGADRRLEEDSLGSLDTDDWGSLLLDGDRGSDGSGHSAAPPGASALEEGPPPLPPPPGPPPPVGPVVPALPGPAPVLDEPGDAPFRKVLKSTKWGVFRLTPKQAVEDGEGFYGGYQAVCPFHKVNAKTRCTVYRSITGPGKDVMRNTLRRLMAWCLRHDTHPLVKLHQAYAPPIDDVLPHVVLFARCVDVGPSEKPLPYVVANTVLSAVLKSKLVTFTSCIPF